MINFIKKYLKCADIIMSLHQHNEFNYNENIFNFLKNIDITKDYYNLAYHYYKIKDFTFFKRNFYKISNFIFFDFHRYIKDDGPEKFSFRMINK